MTAPTVMPVLAVVASLDNIPILMYYVCRFLLINNDFVNSNCRKKHVRFPFIIYEDGQLDIHLDESHTSEDELLDDRMLFIARMLYFKLT